jgi:hypothetical protein
MTIKQLNRRRHVRKYKAKLIDHRRSSRLHQGSLTANNPMRYGKGRGFGRNGAARGWLEQQNRRVVVKAEDHKLLPLLLADAA